MIKLRSDNHPFMEPNKPAQPYVMGSWKDVSMSRRTDRWTDSRTNGWKNGHCTVLTKAFVRTNIHFIIPFKYRISNDNSRRKFFCCKVFVVTFLDATTHLYKRSCPSVGPSVGPSVCPVLFSNDDYGRFQRWKVLKWYHNQWLSEWRWSSRILCTPAVLVSFSFPRLTKDNEWDEKRKLVIKIYSRLSRSNWDLLWKIKGMNNCAVSMMIFFLQQNSWRLAWTFFSKKI